MKRRHTEKGFREQLHLTQQQLADYAGVSRSSLAHSETSAGRSVNTKASLKIMQLQMLLLNRSFTRTPLKEAIEKDISEDENKILQTLLRKKRQHEYKLIGLEQKLEKMTSEYDEAITWLNLLHHLQSEEDAKVSELDRKWFSWQVAVAEMKIRKISPANQLQLRSKILLMGAEVDMIEKILNKEV
jgi:transcriptional regulator with XRE-family HTH domain